MRSTGPCEAGMGFGRFLEGSHGRGITGGCSGLERASPAQEERCKIRIAPRLLAISKQGWEMARTLYIRHVPDDVAERLEKLASRAGVPLSTFALQELSESARRADNAELLQALPSAAIEPAVILDALRQSRAER